MNYKHLPKNVEDHEKHGYEICYSKQDLKDDRAFAPDASHGKSQNKVMRPVLKKTTDGYEMVLMRITKERAKENAQKRMKEEFEKYRLGQKSISRKGNEINSHGGELKY